MKKTLFTIVAACCMMACGTKSAETTAENAGAANPAQSGAGEIAYVQVEALLAQCDLYKNEGAALQERPKRPRKAGRSAKRACRPKPPSCRKNIRRD